MRKLVATEFMTLDGVMEKPEQWVFEFHSEETARFKLNEMLHADALLLGRHTYDIFANSWPGYTGQLADLMNGIQKYVITTTERKLAWNNSKAITDDPIEAVSALKDQGGADMLIAGSATVVDTLAQHHLIDEYRLFVCPLVLGSGKRLFTATGSTPGNLTLAELTTFDTGALLLRYSVGA